MDRLFFYGADGTYMQKVCFARDIYYWVFGTYQLNENKIHVVFDHCLSENTRCLDPGKGSTWTDLIYAMPDADTLLTRTSPKDGPTKSYRIKDWKEFCK